MVLRRLFGSGGKDKPPFRAPREAMALRQKIDVENRENFPNAARFQEIVKESRSVFASLDAIISAGEYTDEASKIKEDIKSRIAELADKIDRNRMEAKKDEKEDYVGRNIDYLQRKSTRNSAKTLFTDFLEKVAFVKQTKDSDAADSTSLELINTVFLLNTNYFTKHKEDKEIQGLKKELIKKLSELEQFLNQNKTPLQPNLVKLLKLSNQLSQE